MAQIRKPSVTNEVPQAILAAGGAGITGKVARGADVQRKRVRTLAKQQQGSERVAAASGELSAGINEAASAAEELKRAAAQMSARQIQELVGQIQGEVETIAEGIDEGAEAVRLEVEMSSQILQQLEQVRGDAAAARSLT